MTLEFYQRINQLNGKQYPYGFVSWLRKVGRLLGNHPFYYEKLDADSWLQYFNDGYSPEVAGKIDLTEQG